MTYAMPVGVDFNYLILEEMKGLHHSPKTPSDQCIMHHCMELKPLLTDLEICFLLLEPNASWSSNHGHMKDRTSTFILLGSRTSKDKSISLVKRFTCMPKYKNTKFLSNYISI